jgi:acyl transferase domain-containing protein
MGKQITNGTEHREPLAIVGIGLRFPMDSNNVEELWTNLLNATNGIIPVPKDRWNADYFTDKDLNKAGKIAHCSGGFIKDINGFDNEFFNLAPYTCHNMDPQQRLLLEVTFEALQDAGLRLKDVSGSETSVYIGGFHYDHYVMALQNSARDQMGSNTTMGVSLTSLANRISNYFNLKGPSVTVDTACSASLVGFHHACQSIWNGEAKMAISGGVNALLRPETSIMLSKGGFLGPSGLCQSFDSAADGYVRSEGVAVAIIKTLTSALQNKDRIYALVEGTAIIIRSYI